MRASLGVVVLTLALVAGCAGSVSPSVAPSRALSGGPLPSGTFVAEYEYGSGDTGGGHATFVSLFDDQSGRYLRDLLRFDGHPQPLLAGFSRAADGSVIYATARGPSYRSNVRGDPLPGSCGGTVYLLDAGTARVTSLFSVPKDWTVRAPVMSPDGRAVAYLSQACTATSGAVSWCATLLPARNGRSGYQVRRRAGFTGAVTVVSWCSR
jgi:hypothetical protein